MGVRLGVSIMGGYNSPSKKIMLSKFQLMNLSVMASSSSVHVYATGEMINTNSIWLC